MNEVEALSYDIDGLFVYKLLFKKDAMMQSLADGRPLGGWKFSRRKNLYGTRRVAECGRTYECVNLVCPYLKT